MKHDRIRKSRHDWMESIAVYLKPRVIGMLFLGFAAGLPFLLIFSTLNVWLREAGVSRTEIGFFAWVGIAFSIKVFWAPLADHFRLPILGRLGKRRSWMLLGQIGVMVGLLGMSVTDPAQNLGLMAVYALVVAFSSATQDIGLDAYRIEAVDREYQGAMAANYQLGWRLGALLAGAGALYLAEGTSWTLTYQAMAICMLVGILTVLVVKEPEVKEAAPEEHFEWEEELEQRFDHIQSPRLRAFLNWFYTAVARPFSDFFARNGWNGLVILIFVGIYKISDIVMGNMAGPLYVDLGFTKSEIASVTKVFGFFATIGGAYLGGVLIMRYGIMRILLLGAVLVATTNLFFALLSEVGHSVPLLSLAIGADNLTAGLAGSVFIAYLSSLTSVSFTATQYALFSSIMTLPGKFISGFSGVVVDATDYTTFFLTASALGIPAILLVIYFMWREAREPNEPQEQQEQEA